MGVQVWLGRAEIVGVLFLDRLENARSRVTCKDGGGCARENYIASSLWPGSAVRFEDAATV